MFATFKDSKYYPRGQSDLGKVEIFVENKHRTRILRSQNHEFAETVPLNDEAQDPIFQVSSVASANDCTGITVTVPNKDFEANSVAHLATVNVTSKESGK